MSLVIWVRRRLAREGMRDEYSRGGGCAIRSWRVVSARRSPGPTSEQLKRLCEAFKGGLAQHYTAQDRPLGAGGLCVRACSVLVDVAWRSVPDGRCVSPAASAQKGPLFGAA